MATLTQKTKRERGSYWCQTFLKVSEEFKLGRELRIETLEQSNTFYIFLSRRWTETNPILLCQWITEWLPTQNKRRFATLLRGLSESELLPQFLHGFYLQPIEREDILGWRKWLSVAESHRLGIGSFGWTAVGHADSVFGNNYIITVFRQFGFIDVHRCSSSQCTLDSTSWCTNGFSQF